LAETPPHDAATAPRAAVWRLKVPNDPACLDEAATKVLTVLEARG